MTTDAGDSRELLAPGKQSLWGAFGALVASGGALVCCVLPAVMVSLGAGATLAGLVTAVPQLIWLSERKGLVFGVATFALIVAGALMWRARYAPCPADPKLAAACARLRRWSVALYAFSVLATISGAVFAVVLPRFS